MDLVESRVYYNANFLKNFLERNGCKTMLFLLVKEDEKTGCKKF